MLKDESFSLLPSEPLWMCSVLQEGNRAKSITVSCTAVVELWVPSTLWNICSLLLPSESLARSKAQKTHQLKACRETEGAKWKASLIFVPLFNFLNCICCMSEAVRRLRVGIRQQGSFTINHQLLLQTSDQNMYFKRTFFSSYTNYISYWGPKDQPTRSFHNWTFV